MSVTKGDYSSAQHARICSLENLMEGMVRIIKTGNQDMILAVILHAEEKLEAGKLYHEDYSKWIEKFNERGFND
jgi:hypothetical protein